MGRMFLIQIKTTPAHNINSTFNRISDMGKGISENISSLKQSLNKLNRSLTPIEVKAMEIVAINETLVKKESLLVIKSQLDINYQELASLKDKLVNGKLFLEDKKDILNPFDRLNSTMQQIHLSEARKERLDTALMLRTAFKEISYSKVDFKNITKTNTTIIRAKNVNNGTISVILNSNGTAEVDLSGIPKERCQIETNKILNKLREAGLELEVKKTFQHESFEGNNTTKQVGEFFNPLSPESVWQVEEYATEFQLEDENTREDERQHQLFNHNRQRN